MTSNKDIQKTHKEARKHIKHILQKLDRIPKESSSRIKEVLIFQIEENLDELNEILDFDSDVVSLTSHAKDKLKSLVHADKDQLREHIVKLKNSISFIAVTFDNDAKKKDDLRKKFGYKRG